MSSGKFIFLSVFIVAAFDGSAGVLSRALAFEERVKALGDNCNTTSSGRSDALPVQIPKNLE